jgi:hypothetical protein
MASHNIGDWIRLNRQGAQPEEVLTALGNIVATYRRNLYHATKMVHADPAARATARPKPSTA